MAFMFEIFIHLLYDFFQIQIVRNLTRFEIYVFERLNWFHLKRYTAT